VLWPATTGRRLRKTRYEVRWKNYIVEIDVDYASNRGLIVAEVKFPTETSCEDFRPPGWFEREVTRDKRYSNIRLATKI